MAEARWLDEGESRAWRGWLAMSGRLAAQIERDLQSECGLSSPDFAVLVHLSETAGHRMRMTELADALGWSKSRVSHQCSRMQARGLVAREGCPDDARSSYAVLTTCGRDEIVQAAPRHVESVRRHLIDLLDPRQVQALSTIASTVLAHLDEMGAQPGDACGGMPPTCPTRGGPPPQYQAEPAPTPGGPASGRPAEPSPAPLQP